MVCVLAIIAPLKGHEFHRACSNIGGQFISISPASQNCINIMEIRKADKSVDDLLDGPGAEKSLLAAKIQRLHTFFSLLIPDMSHEERQLLDDAMICTYGVKGITHDNASLEQLKNPGCYKEMPILGDLYEILAASPETKRLANILNRLVNGSARSFNQQTNVALDNKYIVLDISELTGDLLTVGMFVALDFVWDKAKENRTAEKAIFVDECWQLIGASSNRQAAESVLELAKTIRGYGGSLVCATQDLNDFFALDDGKYGKGIINNSKTKILLNLEEEEAQRVQGVLHLSEAELMEITHFERGSALISTNNNTLVEDTTLIQNAATPYPVEFAFSKDWDGFTKTALFEAGGVSMAVVLNEDKCDIPGECLKKGGIPLKIAVYGIKGEERKSTGWHVTSKILFPANISVGTGGSGDPMGDEAYKQIMGIIGDPSTAGFGNKTLTEVIVEIQRSISGTASDKEVDDMLNDAFASSDPGGSTPDNTASDKEVDDLLNDVFGEQP